MNTDAQKKILKLELAQQAVIIHNLSKKITRYEKANKIVKNTIAQQEIDDLKTELKTAELQKEILSSKIQAIQD